MLGIVVYRMVMLHANKITAFILMTHNLETLQVARIENQPGFYRACAQSLQSGYIQ